MTFAESRDKLDEYLSFGSYSDAQPKPNLAALIQEAYREISTESEWNRTDTTFATVAGTTEYTLTNPPDWIRVLDVLYGTTTRLIQTDEVDIRRVDWLWTQASNGTPSYWWISKPNTVRLYPPPSAIATCYVHGTRVPTAFTADTDLPGFPIRYHDALPLRAAWLQMKKNATGDEYKRALNYRDESNALVSDLKEELLGQGTAVFQRRMTRRPPERLNLGGPTYRRI